MSRSNLGADSSTRLLSEKLFLLAEVDLVTVELRIETCIMSAVSQRPKKENGRIALKQ
jgi:hypothetical protein